MEFVTLPHGRRGLLCFFPLPWWEKRRWRGIYSTIPLRGGVPFYGGEGAFHQSSWALLCRVRILSNAIGVILSPRFSRAWGSHLTPQPSSWAFAFWSREDLIFLGFFIKTLKDGILTSHNALLKMKDWVDEIATSHKTLLAVTDLDSYFISICF